MVRDNEQGRNVKIRTRKTGVCGTRHIHDGTLMRFSVRTISKIAVCLPVEISLPSVLAGIPRANEPSWGRISPVCVLCQVGAPGRSSRTSPHSWKLSLSESPVPVPTGTTRSAGLSRRVSKQHHVHRLAPYGQHDE